MEIVWPAVYFVFIPSFVYILLLAKLKKLSSCDGIRLTSKNLQALGYVIFLGVLYLFPLNYTWYLVWKGSGVNPISMIPLALYAFRFLVNSSISNAAPMKKGSTTNEGLYFSVIIACIFLYQSINPVAAYLMMSYLPRSLVSGFSTLEGSWKNHSPKTWKQAHQILIIVGDLATLIPIIFTLNHCAGLLGLGKYLTTLTWLLNAQTSALKIFNIEAYLAYLPGLILASSIYPFYSKFNPRIQKIDGICSSF